jgi:hypothetical protein
MKIYSTLLIVAARIISSTTVAASVAAGATATTSSTVGTAGVIAAGAESPSLTKTYQLRQLTDFIWKDYNERLEATLGNFKNLDRAVVEAMMIHYVASCYPFVFSFNDFCRLVNLQTSDGGDTNLHPEVVEHTRSDLEHFELYKRDYIKYGAWRVQPDIKPFIALHNDLWTTFGQTPRPYFYHLPLIFEVMSTVWLGKWYELSQHHDLDFVFLGKEHYQDDDNYKRHLLAHQAVLSEEIPAHIYWIMRSAYDTIGAGFVSWFNNQLESAKTNPADYIEQRTKHIY